MLHNYNQLVVVLVLLVLLVVLEVLQELQVLQELLEHILLDMLLLLVFYKQLLHKFLRFHKLDKKLQHNHKKELVLVLVLHIFDYKLLFVDFCKRLQ
jgi:hypothetical protein